MAYTPDGKQLVTGGDDGAIRIWDAQTGKLVRETVTALPPVTFVRFSKDGSQIAAGYEDDRKLPAGTNESEFG